jgi:SagB-type dehydrogenase family enzyme
MTSDLSIAWRCRDGVTLLPGTGGGVTLAVDADTKRDLQPPAPGVSDALLLLGGGADEGALIEGLRGDDHAVALLFHYVGRLRRFGLLVADVRWNDRLLATLRPLSMHFDVMLPPDAECRWQLSRFAYLHREGDDLVLECPEAPCVAHLKCHEAVAWLYKAFRPTTPEAGTPPARFLALLGKLGFLVDPGNGESDAQQTWEFHDRLFHHKARRHDDFRPHGGTYRFRDRFPSPPAIRPGYVGDTVRLATPERCASRPLLEVMEERRSRREMGSRPVSRDQVAELLYRVARVREIMPSPLQDCLLRAYPSGGAIHELEFYLAVGVCRGLSTGFYHYRGNEHALTRVEGGSAPAREMLADCAASWGQPGQPPQCLIVLASRLPRLAWKYEAIAYKISLMNAGVVLQSLYLVCTELGLNGSAVGSGTPHLFADATNASSWEETSIAEFGFGSRPD